MFKFQNSPWDTRIFREKPRGGMDFWLWFFSVFPLWEQEWESCLLICIKLAMNLEFTSHPSPGLLSYPVWMRLRGLVQGYRCTIQAEDSVKFGVCRVIVEPSRNVAVFLRHAGKWNWESRGGVEPAQSQAWKQRRKKERQIEITRCPCWAVI